MVQEAPELSFALAFDLDFGIPLVPWGQIPSLCLKVIGEGLIGLGKFEYRQFDCGIIMGMLVKANNIFPRYPIAINRVSDMNGYIAFVSLDSIL